jgi:hypothetical protein
MVARQLRAIVIALSITSIALSTSAARADVRPTPSPTSTLSPLAQYQIDLEEFKIEWKEFQEARALREQQLRMILNDFNRALRKATEDARIAGKNAGSKAALAAARATAAAERDEAVALLGPEPVVPTPPAKPLKGAKVSSPSQKPGKRN